MPKLRDPTRRLFQVPRCCGGAITVVRPYELGKRNRLQFGPFLGLRCDSGRWALYLLLNSTERGPGSFDAGRAAIIGHFSQDHDRANLFNLTGTKYSRQDAKTKAKTSIPSPITSSQRQRRVTPRQTPLPPTRPPAGGLGAGAVAVPFGIRHPHRRADRADRAHLVGGGAAATTQIDKMQRKSSSSLGPSLARCRCKNPAEYRWPDRRIGS